MAHGSRQFSLDRFIPRRPNTRLAVTFDLLNSSDPTVGCNKLDVIEDCFYMNTARQKYCKENYRKLLKAAIFSEKNNALDFSNCNKKEQTETVEQVVHHWPVKPRRKPLIPGYPSVMLDLPDLDTHFCRNVIDWGKSGYIGATYENEVHLWHPEKNIRIRVTDVTETVENCIKWNVDGNQFTIALAGGRVAVYDMQQSKNIYMGTCPCKFTTNNYKKSCSLISSQWTQSNDLLTGCSQGTLSLWSHSLECLTIRIRAHEGDITKLIISCQEKCIASAGIDQTIAIWTYPGIELVQNIKCIMPTKAIAWHPWRDSLLVVGDVDRYYLWDIQNMAIKQSILFADSYIDSLTFNPMSAELLVSLHTFYESRDKEVSYLKVMKNMHQVVDEVRCNEFKIPYLLWNHTGTQLGAASTEETFCIWHFFGTSTTQEKKYLKREKKKFSENDFADSLGKTIR